MPRMRRTVLVLLSVTALTACSEAGASDCVDHGAAKICLTLDGAVQVTAEGLAPGSDLTVSVVDGPTQTVEADEEGTSGAIGFLTVVAPESASVEVTGTDAGGQRFVAALRAG